ncbi:MAG: AMP-binding protein [Rubrivivax sp.]|nr:AMP-binding protein [Rubrivivax sp.]
MHDDVQDLRRHAAADPERRAIVCGTRSLSYGELEARSNRLAAAWRRLGLVRGDHVATLMGNVPEALAAAWAAWRCGVYLTPVPTTLAAPETAAMVADCEARLVLADGGSAAAAALAAQVPRLVMNGVRWRSIGGEIHGYEPIELALATASPEPAADEPPGALMMYTSGTTGAPKGVIRPLLPADWRGTPPFAGDLIALFGVGGPDVRYLSTAPLYHAAPLRTALAVTAGGGTVHVMDRFDAEAALDVLEREAITHSQWVPAMFQRLLALPDERRRALRAPAHRTAIHGAAPCPIAVKRAMIDWWGPILLEYYSGSEGVGLTLIDSREALAHPGSVGRARKGRLHVVDDTGRERASGETGLVCFSGVAPFEYHRAPEKTAARTLHAADGTRLQTFGDLGHVDAEGWLFLTDRLDDMIISGGVNVYPQEIEAVIGAVPGVWECAVVGVEDGAFGERPIAFIVPRRGAPIEPLRAALVDAIERNLGRIRRPDAIHVIDELPRSPTGKLLRRKLRPPAAG